jgi:hypothetical protein
MTATHPDRYPIPSAEQIETWRVFRAQRERTAPDKADPWRASGGRRAEQLVAVQEGWSVGITRGDGKILVLDGPFQGQNVASKQAADEKYPEGLVCRLRVKAKKGTKHAPAVRIALDVHQFATSD